MAGDWRGRTSMKRFIPTILMIVGSCAVAADQGLYDDRVVIGQISDLSGATVAVSYTHLTLPTILLV